MVLLGLGKIGTRVLVRLRELDIPVVVVEEDPEARGIPLARSLHVPTVLGDVTQEGVLEAAKIRRARALLALTSIDTTNLEAALYARSVKPELRVALRLYDDEFATAVYRTLRTAHPQALTRSRSVSHLAAPSFAVAMMGRQILGAVPVERKVMLFAALEVAGHPQLEGRTVDQAFRAGAWRVLALDATPCGRPPPRPGRRTAVRSGRRHRPRHPGPALRPGLGPAPGLCAAAGGPGGDRRDPPRAGRAAARAASLGVTPLSGSGGWGRRAGGGWYSAEAQLNIPIASRTSVSVASATAFARSL